MEDEKNSGIEKVTPRSRKRWFRFAFSLRTMFVVVTIFGILLGWQLQIVHERNAILREIKEEVAQDQFHFGRELGDSLFCRELHVELRADDIRISILRRMLGDQPMAEILVPVSLNPKLLSRMEAAFSEACLVATEYDKDDPESFSISAFRDSLSKPVSRRQLNIGTVFKTGLKEYPDLASKPPQDVY